MPFDLPHDITTDTERERSARALSSLEAISPALALSYIWLVVFFLNFIFNTRSLSYDYMRFFFVTF